MGAGVGAGVGVSGAGVGAGDGGIAAKHMETGMQKMHKGSHVEQVFVVQNKAQRQKH